MPAMITESSGLLAQGDAALSRSRLHLIVELPSSRIPLSCRRARHRFDLAVFSDTPKDSAISRWLIPSMSCRTSTVRLHLGSPPIARARAIRSAGSQGGQIRVFETSRIGDVSLSKKYNDEAQCRRLRKCINIMFIVTLNNQDLNATSSLRLFT